jgi:hypothetical protein
MCHAGGAKAFVSGRGYPKREVIDQFHKRGMVSPLAFETTVRDACIAFFCGAHACLGFVSLWAAYVVGSSTPLGRLKQALTS